MQTRRRGIVEGFCRQGETRRIYAGRFWLYLLRSGALHPLSKGILYQPGFKARGQILCHEPRAGYPDEYALEHLKEFMKYVKDNPNKFAGTPRHRPSLSHPCVMLSKKYQLEMIPVPSKERLTSSSRSGRAHRIWNRFGRLCKAMSNRENDRAGYSESKPGGLHARCSDLRRPRI